MNNKTLLKMQRLILYTTIFVVAFTTIASAAIALVNVAPRPSFATKIETFATGTRAVSAFTVITIDSLSANQGVCLKIKDADGAGFTYLTTQNGAGTFTKTSCE